MPKTKTKTKTRTKTKVGHVLKTSPPDRFLDVLSLPRSLSDATSEEPITNLMKALIINPEHIVSVEACSLDAAYGRLGARLREANESEQCDICKVVLSNGREHVIALGYEEFADALRKVNIGTIAFP